MPAYTYTLHYRVVGAGAWTLFASDVTSPQTITGLISGVSYDIRLTTTSGGDTVYSYAVGTTAAGAPDAPSGVALLEAIRISWTDQAGVFAHKIYRRVDNASEVLLSAVSDSQDALTDEPAAGHTYQYRVAGVNREGEGPKNDPVSYTPGGFGSGLPVAAPTFRASRSPDADGVIRFYNSLAVDIVAEAGAQIYYTLDGTEPFESPALLYIGPLSFRGAGGIQAIAVIRNQFSPVSTLRFLKYGA